MNEDLIQYKKRKTHKEHVETALMLENLSKGVNDMKHLLSPELLATLREILGLVETDVHRIGAITVTNLIRKYEGASIRLAKMKFIPSLVKDIEIHDTETKIASMNALFAIAFTSEVSARILVDDGGIEGIRICLENENPTVRIAAVRALYSVAKHNSDLTLEVVQKGILKSLLLGFREQSIELQKYFAVTIHEISRHGKKVGLYIKCSGLLVYLGRYIRHPDEKLKAICLCTFTNLYVDRSVTIDQVITEYDFGEEMINCLSAENKFLKICAAIIICHASHHDLLFLEKLMRIGLFEPLMEVVRMPAPKDIWRPAVVAFSNIIGFHEDRLHEVQELKVHFYLANSLYRCKYIYTTLPIIYLLTQIGKYSHEIAVEIANLNIYPKIIEVYDSKNSVEETEKICKDALGLFVPLCERLCLLRLYVLLAPRNLLTYCLNQFSSTIPKNARERRWFLMYGGLRRIIRLQPEFEKNTEEWIHIQRIISSYPKSITSVFKPRFFIDAWKQMKKHEAKSQRTSMYKNMTPQEIFGEEYEVKTKRNYRKDIQLLKERIFEYVLPGHEYPLQREKRRRTSKGLIMLRPGESDTSDKGADFYTRESFQSTILKLGHFNVPSYLSFCPDMSVMQQYS